MCIHKRAHRKNIRMPPIPDPTIPWLSWIASNLLVYCILDRGSRPSQSLSAGCTATSGPNVGSLLNGLMVDVALLSSSWKVPSRQLLVDKTWSFNMNLRGNSTNDWKNSIISLGHHVYWIEATKSLWFWSFANFSGGDSWKTSAAR